MNKFFSYLIIGVVLGLISPVINVALQPLNQLGIPSPILLLLSFTVFVLILLTIGQVLIIQSESKPLGYIQTSIDQFPSLDLTALEGYTKELKNLGFNQLGDYTLKATTRPALMRLFQHSEHHCFVEVYQINGFPIACSVRSFFMEKWSLSNVDRQPQGLLGGLMYMRKHKQRLWIAQPNCSPSELTVCHLKRREELVKDLKIHVLTDSSTESYFVQTQLEANERLQIKNLLLS